MISGERSCKQPWFILLFKVKASCNVENCWENALKNSLKKWQMKMISRTCAYQGYHLASEHFAAEVSLTLWVTAHSEQVYIFASWVIKYSHPHLGMIIFFGIVKTRHEYCLVQISGQRDPDKKMFPYKDSPMGDSKIRPYSQCGKEKELDCEAAVFSLSYSYTFVMFYFFFKSKTRKLFTLEIFENLNRDVCNLLRDHMSTKPAC